MFVKSCHIQWKKAVSENTAASQATDEHPNGKWIRVEHCWEYKRQGNAEALGKNHVTVPLFRHESMGLKQEHHVKSTLALKTLTMVSVLGVSVRRKQIQDTSIVTVYFTAWLLLSLGFKKCWLSSPVTQKVNSPYISPPKIIHDSELCQVHSKTFFDSFYYIISPLQDYKYNLCSRT